MISQYTLYLAMFCPLHNNINKKQLESISAIHPAITENVEDLLMKFMSNISICESHNTTIPAMSNLFHNSLSKE